MTPLPAWEAFLGQPRREMSLAHGALLIACAEYPELDVAAYLRRLDEMPDHTDQIFVVDRELRLNGSVDAHCTVTPMSLSPSRTRTRSCTRPAS